jgi:hypothetical protein
MRPVRGLAPI